MPRPLSEHEIEIIRQAENAAFLRDLQLHPAWAVYCKLAQSKIQDIRDMYESSKLDKDGTWVAHASLKAVKEFQAGMEELVNLANDLLDPEALKRLINSAQEPQDV